MPYTNAGIVRGYQQGLLTDGVHAAMHTGQPTNANQIAAPGRVELESTEFDFSSNMARINARQMFTTPTTAQSAPTHLGFWSASSGGTLWGWLALSGIGALAANRDIIIDDDDLVFRVSNSGAWKNAAIQLWLNSGLFAGDRYIAGHSGDADASNEVDIDRVVLDSGNWTYTTNRATYGVAVTMDDVNVDVADMPNFAIWSALTGGNILISADLAGGGLTSINTEDSVSFAANSILTYFPQS